LRYCRFTSAASKELSDVSSKTSKGSKLSHDDKDDDDDVILAFSLANTSARQIASASLMPSDLFDAAVGSGLFNSCEALGFPGNVATARTVRRTLKKRTTEPMKDSIAIGIRDRTELSSAEVIVGGGEVGEGAGVQKVGAEDFVG